jgi:hypothetical protein
MSRLFLLLSLLSLALKAFSQESALPNTLLWKIEGNGLEKPSYLYGTMHTDEDAAFGFMDSVLIAFESCEKFAGELNPDSLDKQALAKEALLPEGTTLRTLLSPADYERVKKECWKRLHLPMFIIERIKPFYVTVMLTEGFGNPNKVLDMYFVKLAKKQGKAVFGLEKAEDQLAVLNSIPIKKQTDILVETVRNADSTLSKDPLLAVYARRDLNAIDSLTRADTSMGQEFMKRILYDRNEVMARGIAGLAKTSPVFVGVGAAHLPGEQGVISRLRRIGYRVSPVISPVFLKPKYVRKQAK